MSEPLGSIHTVFEFGNLRLARLLRDSLTIRVINASRWSLGITLSISPFSRKSSLTLQQNYELLSFYVKSQVVAGRGPFYQKSDRSFPEPTKVYYHHRSDL